MRRLDDISRGINDQLCNQGCEKWRTEASPLKVLAIKADICPICVTLMKKRVELLRQLTSFTSLKLYLAHGGICVLMRAEGSWSSSQMLQKCKHTCARATGIDVKSTTLIKKHQQSRERGSASVRTSCYVWGDFLLDSRRSSSVNASTLKMLQALKVLRWFKQNNNVSCVLSMCTKLT